MKSSLLAVGLATFGLVATLGSIAPDARAANADNPYGNVDRSNDAGNNTGDSRVDGLNSSQLNQNYKGNVQTRPPSGAGMTAAPPKAKGGS